MEVQDRMSRRDGEYDGQTRVKNILNALTYLSMQVCSTSCHRGDSEVPRIALFPSKAGARGRGDSIFRYALLICNTFCAKSER